jgi:hypothetical protein
MPRYFFHLDDDRWGRDDEGVELADLKTAGRDALTLLADVARERPATLWRPGGRQLTCTDARGRALFTLKIDAKLAPAEIIGLETATA